MIVKIEPSIVEFYYMMVQIEKSNIKSKTTF